MAKKEQARDKSGRWKPGASGSTKLPTSDPRVKHVVMPKPEPIEVPGSVAVAAPPKPRQMLTSFDSPKAPPPQERLAEALAAYDDDGDFTLNERRRTAVIQDGAAEISWNGDGEYIVSAQVQESAGNYWNPPEYADVEILTTRDADEAVEVAYQVAYDGVDDYLSPDPDEAYDSRFDY